MKKMINIDRLISRLEFDDFIKDLREFGLSEEDIEGWLEFYGDTWVDLSEDKNYDKN